jgi:hypothetical protein
MFSSLWSKNIQECLLWTKHLSLLISAPLDNFGTHRILNSMCICMCIYCTEASKFKNYYSVKSTVPYRTEKSQERIPEDHRNGARMGLGHASEGGRCVGSLQVLKLLEAEYSKHVRTTNHFRWNVWIVHDSSCACRNIPPSGAFLAETFLILICWEREHNNKKRQGWSHRRSLGFNLATFRRSWEFDSWSESSIFS